MRKINSRNRATDSRGLTLTTRLRELLRQRQGDRTLVDFSSEIGLSEAMLRTVLAGSHGPGAATLAALIVWDPDTFEGLAIDYLRELGRYRAKQRAEKVSRQAA